MGLLGLMSLVSLVSLVEMVGSASLVGLVGLLGHARLIGPVGLASMLGLVGLAGIGCQIGLIKCFFLLFVLIQKYFKMEILSLMTQKDLMIPKCLMVWRSFRIKVWTLMIAFLSKMILITEQSHIGISYFHVDGRW